MAVSLSLVHLTGAALFFRWMFNIARTKGLLAKLGTQ